jgi:type IV pilus assembly protein PilM
MDGREQEFAVHQAFGQQSPIPLEELSLDFFEVDQKVTTRSTTSTFQVYATRKEVVDSRVAALTKAGLKPLTVDVHANSLLKVWRLASQVHPERRQWMLVDIGLNQTSLCTVPREEPLSIKKCLSVPRTWLSHKKFLNPSL